MSKSKVFMRAYWGINDNSHRILKRKFKVDKNIKAVLDNPNTAPFVTYVWGKNNYEFLTSLGFDCIKVSDDPCQWDLIKCQYRHKLEALRLAMGEGVDEMVHLDWDCFPTKKMDEEFWNILGKKAEFQANLIFYKKHKAKWRKTEGNLIPNGGFVYIRDRDIPDKLIKIWETMQGPSAEPPMAKLTDDMSNGWHGREFYFDLFEPEVCQPRSRCQFPEFNYKPTLYFKHYIS